LVLSIHRRGSASGPQQAPVTTAEFDRWMSEISNWGRWGAQDERGTLNLITPQKRQAAARLVRDGVSISLALDLNTRCDALNANPFEQSLTVGEFDGHEVAGDAYRPGHADSRQPRPRRGRLGRTRAAALGVPLRRLAAAGRRGHGVAVEPDRGVLMDCRP
jgi:hypothetical protein